MRHFRAVAQVETPQQKASQRWAGHVGTLVEAKQHWKYATLLCLLGLVGSVYYFGVQLAAKPPVQIIYVGVDAAGIATILGRAPGLVTPTALMIEERIRRFVQITRGLTLDKDAIRKQWLDDAYQWVTPRGSALLTEWAQDREPLIKAGKISIAIDIEQLLRQSDHSYEVRWRETLRNQNNGLMEQTTWSGNYVVKVDKPTSEAQAQANATGVFIDYFAVTKTSGPSRKRGKDAA